MSDVHARRVPVEHRWLGVDRRSLLPAGVAFVVLALWAWVMPWVAQQVAWDDEIQPGEALQVTEEVTMTVAPGWGVQEGLRTTDDTRSGYAADDQIVLVKDGVLLWALQGPFSGTADELMDQAELITNAQLGDASFQVSGEAVDITTAGGLRGVSQAFASTGTIGTISTFVVDGTGFEIRVTGAEAQVTALADEIDTMIHSLAQEDAS